MTAPPYEWPTRMAGLLTRPSVPFTAATSPSFVSRPYWAAITSYPSDCSVGITLLKHEPSAQIPWQKTMLGLTCIGFMLLSLVASHTLRFRQDPDQLREKYCLRPKTKPLNGMPSAP